MKSMLALLAAIAVAPTPARADDHAAVARTHADEAMKRFNLGEFPAAISEYKLAYAAMPDPAFLYDIAQAYRISNNAQQALFFYRSFLHASPDAANRDEVENRIQRLQEQIKAQQPLTTPPSMRPPVSATTPTPPSPAPIATVVSRPAPPKKPIYKKWWLWTGVGVVAVGIGVGVGLAFGLNQTQPPVSHFGNMGVF